MAQRWRFKVAGWHDMPPASAPPQTLAALYDQLVTDLDTHAVLTTLHRLEIDHSTLSGAKYEIFNLIDNILALDVGRMVNNVRR
jgi:hypothetical protein